MNPILRFLIGADTSRLDRDLKKGEKSIGMFKSSMLKLGGVLAGVFAVGAITNWVKASVEAADTELKAQAALLQALNNNKAAQEDLIKLAAERQKVTLFGDDETVRAQATIAMFVKSGQAIRELTPAVQDLATGLGMDLNSAALLVGKTLSSSTNLMKRYGMDVEGAAGSQERLDSIMQAVNSRFKDQAAIAARTGLGPLQQFQNAWGDLREELGKLFLPVLAKVAKALSNAISWMMVEVPKAFTAVRLAAVKLGFEFEKLYYNFQKFAAGRKLLTGDFVGYAAEIGKAGAAYAKATADYNQAVQNINKAQSNRNQGAVGGVSGPIIESNLPSGGGQIVQRAAGLDLAPIAPKAIGEVNSSLTQTNTVLAEMDTRFNDLAASIPKFGEQLKRGVAVAAQYELQLAGINAMTGLMNDLSAIAAMEQADRAEAMRAAAHKAVNSFIAEGVAAIIKNTLAGPTGALGPLAIPIAGAAGAGASMLFNALIPKFAMGGIVPEGFNNDTYPALLSSGETVIPKPKALGSGGGSVDVRGVIFGDSIKISTIRTNQRYNRVRGY